MQVGGQEHSNLDVLVEIEDCVVAVAVERNSVSAQYLGSRIDNFASCGPSFDRLVEHFAIARTLAGKHKDVGHTRTRLVGRSPPGTEATTGRRISDG